MIKNLKINVIKVKENTRCIDTSIYKEGIGHYLVRRRSSIVGDLVYFNGESVFYISYLAGETFNLFYSGLTDKLTDEVEKHFHPNEHISDHVQKVNTEDKISPVPFKDEYETERQNFLLRLVAVSQCPEEYLKLQAEAK